MSESKAVENRFVVAAIGEGLFGIPIERVRDVFRVERITRVPLAPPVVAGIANLRGRIVTVIDMRLRLGLSPQTNMRPMAIGIDSGNESYGLLTDRVDDVVTIGMGGIERCPPHLDPRVTAIANGVHAVGHRLLILIDPERLLDFNEEMAA